MCSCVCVWQSDVRSRGGNGGAEDDATKNGPTLHKSQGSDADKRRADSRTAAIVFCFVSCVMVVFAGIAWVLWMPIYSHALSSVDLPKNKLALTIWFGRCLEGGVFLFGICWYWTFLVLLIRYQYRMVDKYEVYSLRLPVTHNVFNADYGSLKYVERTDGSLHEAISECTNGWEPILSKARCEEFNIQSECHGKAVYCLARVLFLDARICSSLAPQKNDRMRDRGKRRR